MDENAARQTDTDIQQNTSLYEKGVKEEAVQQILRFGLRRMDSPGRQVICRGCGKGLTHLHLLLCKAFRIRKIARPHLKGAVQMLNEASRECGGAIINFENLHIEMWAAVCLGAIPPIKVHATKQRFKMQTCIRIEKITSLTKNRMREFYNDSGDTIAKLLWLQGADTKRRKRQGGER
jgi:hypothetical protein